MKKLCCLLVMLCLLPFSAVAEEEVPRRVAAWLPYWDVESALAEAEALGDSLDTVIAFEALFDEDDKPKLLYETGELLATLQSRYAGTDTRVMLSVVNDIELSGGQYDSKSADLLRRLFQTEDSISRHVARLLQLTEQCGAEGLEIDYEALKSDTDLWARFAVFIQQMYSACSARGIALRVVLSWDAPRYVTLPQGPEYVVMCYNLYGYHSGPGPKADLDFLKQTAELYRPYAASVRMAFATGGFDWTSGGIRALKQQEAESMLEEAGVTATRDIASAALYAAFQQDGEDHTVWYADGATLEAWAEAMSGFAGIDLFRLGGNDLDDWQMTLLK